jgi:hypothetical protein
LEIKIRFVLNALTVHLKELKNNITNISNMDNINLQIEHIDRKMITVAIKRNEDAKVKNMQHSVRHSASIKS